MSTPEKNETGGTGKGEVLYFRLVFGIAGCVHARHMAVSLVSRLCKIQLKGPLRTFKLTHYITKIKQT